MPDPKSVLLEADSLIHGDRNAAYGDATGEYTRLAAAYTAITGKPMEAREAMLFMVLLKLNRNQYKQSRDNLVDAAGYVGLLAQASGVDPK